MAEPPRHRIGFGDSLKLTTSLCLTYTVGVALLRAWVRRSTFGADDIVISAATLVCLGHFASNYIALEYGAGKPWSTIAAAGQIGPLNSTSIASVVTFVISLYMSKCAVLIFLARLTKLKQQRILYWSCTAFIAVVGVVSLLIVTVECPLKSGYYWAFHLNQRSCESQSARWYAFTTLDIFTEIMLLVLPTHLVLSLQMPFKKKLPVLAAFYLRLPVIGLSIGRLVYTKRMCGSQIDLGLDSALVLIWLETETSYAIVSSTFSALKAFTASFNSSFGLGFIANAEEGDYYGLSRVKEISAGSVNDSRPVISRSATSATTLKHGLVIQETESSDNIEAERPARVQPPKVRDFSGKFALTPHSGQGRWEARSFSSERVMKDGVIVRETEYTVQQHDANDELPILSESRPSMTYEGR